VTRSGGLVALVLLAAGCAGGGSGALNGAPTTAPPVDLTASPTPGPTPSPDPTGTTVPTATATAASPEASGVPAAGAKDFGYFTAVRSSGSPVRLSFDRALFLTGDEANKAAATHGDETPVPNDYYVVNDSKKLRTLTLASNVAVFGSQALNSYAGEDSVEARRRTVAQLLGFLGTDEGRQTGFNLVYGAAGVVARVEEQYQP
jgi:hypothetical protein